MAHLDTPRIAGYNAEDASECHHLSDAVCSPLLSL